MQNVIVDNVLTNEEIDSIYESIKNPSNHYIMKRFNQTISDFRLPDEINEKIIKYCEEISGESNLKIEEYQFARYKKIVDEHGNIGHPSLTPHYDETFSEPRFTFDYQIKSNTDWPLVVEDKHFTLKDNQALTFSGTHQIHWRTKKMFRDDEFIDMIFFHLKKINSLPKSKDTNFIMEKKKAEYIKKYETEGEVNG